MAGRADFSDEEWNALLTGLMGAGMFVSVSEPDFSDTYAEAGALERYVEEQRETSASTLVRDLADAYGAVFGLMASSEKIEVETLAALRSAAAALAAKAPDDTAAYRALVLGAAERVAQARGGERRGETAAIGKIRAALGLR
jgi:hypothetical protein